MDIIELAKQAGINSPDGFKLTVNHMATFQLEKFAELVATPVGTIASAIRARGTT